MSNLFAGFVFLLLSLNINLGEAASIDLLPDFVGYLCFYLGLKKLGEESGRFADLRPNIIPLIALSALFFLLNLFGWGGALGWLGSILGLGVTALSLYATYQIVMGVGEMEARYRCDLRAARLKQLWKRNLWLQLSAGLLAILAAVLVFGATDASAAALLALPVLALPVLALGIAGIVTAIQFLIAFRKAQKQYEALQSGEAPPEGDPPAGAPSRDAPLAEGESAWLLPDEGNPPDAL